MSHEQVTGISSMATRHVLNELAADYERYTRQHVEVTSIGGVAALRRVQEGEPFDFVVLAADAIDELAAAGLVDPQSRIDVARSGIAVAIAAGAPRPALGDEAAVREALLAARGIGYSTGPSGVHLVRLFERWGVAEAMAPRLVQAPPGVPVGRLVARGEAEIGFQQLSELIHLPGIEVIRVLPAAVQSITMFSAAVCSASRHPADARTLLAFLAAPRSAEAKRRHGMQPAAEQA